MRCIAALSCRLPVRDKRCRCLFADQTGSDLPGTLVVDAYGGYDQTLSVPIGLSFSGRPFAEAQLLAIGQAYQRQVPPEIARPLR